MIVNGIDMGEYLTKAHKLADPFADKYPELVDGLKNREISISKSYLTDIALKDKSLIDSIIKYYAWCQTIFTGDKFPKTDFIGNSVFDIYDIKPEDIIKLEENLTEQWEQQRQEKYEKSKSFVPFEDSTYGNFKARKYPVVDNHTLSMFLQQTKYHIDKSFGKSVPKIGERTFIQTIYGEVDGKLKRFIRVIELRHSTQDYMNVKGVPTFDFTISIKCAPDDQVNHTTCMLRFDSKGMGSAAKAHKNELGTTDSSAYETGEESYNHKMFEELYDAPVNHAHLHIFDRINQFINLGNPISCNAISIKHLLEISKKTYKDDSGFSNIIKDILQTIKENKQTKNSLVNLITALNKSYNELNGERAAIIKQSWEDKFAALKLAIQFIDSIYNIAPEKENTIDNVCQIIALGYDNQDIMTADEEKPIEFVSGWRDLYHIKRYNELKEKQQRGERLSARELKLLDNYGDIDPKQAELAAEEQRKVIEMLENAKSKKNIPCKDVEKVVDEEISNAVLKDFVSEKKEAYAQYLLQKQKEGKHLSRAERNAIKMYIKNNIGEDTFERE